MPIDTLCVIGVGLIGGSLARALKKAGACRRVVGCGRGRENLEKAVALGVIDHFDTHVASAVAGADMIMVAVPLGAMESVFRAMAATVSPHAVITDGGSAKRSVIKAAQAAFGAVPKNLVPGHPIAGAEKSGVEASLDDLYRGREVILTPLPETDPDAITRVRAMWRAVGATVSAMTPERHDGILAATSHLPHLLAYALVDELGEQEERAEIFRYAAGGFRDFTRIASSDPQMWHDICLANADALAKASEAYAERLRALVEAVRRGDGPYIKALFERAKRRRDGYGQT